MRPFAVIRTEKGVKLFLNFCRLRSRVGSSVFRSQKRKHQLGSATFSTISERGAERRLRRLSRNPPCQGQGDRPHPVGRSNERIDGQTKFHVATTFPVLPCPQTFAFANLKINFKCGISRLLGLTFRSKTERSGNAYQDNRT